MIVHELPVRAYEWMYVVVVQSHLDDVVGCSAGPKEVR